MAYNENDVKHEPKEKMFFIELQNGSKAFLQYEKSGNEVDLWHTEVPPECRGQGVAGILAESSIKNLAQNHSKVLLSCTYLQHFYKKHGDKFHDFTNIQT